MANWTDGPEYAPAERPAAFETPDVPALDAPPPVANPAAGAPAEQPRFEVPATPVTPLDQLVPASTQAPRDPQTAFSVVTSALTSQSAWGAAHSGTPGQGAWTPAQPLGPDAAWTPDQPLTQSTVTTVTYPAPAGAYPPPQVNQTSPFPQPGTADWFAPPPAWSRPVTGPQPVTIAQMWAAATPGVIVPLIVGALFSGLSVMMLALSFSLTSRVTHRRNQVRIAYGVAGLALLAIGAVSLLDPAIDLPMLWDVISQWAQYVCWPLPVALLLICGAGLRAGEPPERPL